MKFDCPVDLTNALDEGPIMAGAAMLDTKELAQTVVPGGRQRFA